jgi:hypothetical protein
MIQGKLIGLLLRKLLPYVLDEVVGIIKPLQKYVFQPNELDKEVMKINKRLDRIEEELDESRQPN